jgi:hypothetical protein
MLSQRIKPTMFKNATAACLLALMSLFGVAKADAQTAPTQQSAFLIDMQSSVAKSIGAQDKTVEITLTDSILTVLRVNSNQNASSHEWRNNEATSIAGVASKTLGTDATSARVHTIRVQYLTRDSANPKGNVLDTVEFRKNSKGAFEIHVT